MMHQRHQKVVILIIALFINLLTRDKPTMLILSQEVKKELRMFFIVSLLFLIF